MATVLLVGSRDDMTKQVAASLRAQGWDVVPVVGPEDGLRAIDRTPQVDALVVGGPAAFAARGRLEARLHERHPYAPVVFPTSVDGIGKDLERAFGGEAH